MRPHPPKKSASGSGFSSFSLEDHFRSTAATLEETNASFARARGRLPSDQQRFDSLQSDAHGFFRQLQRAGLGKRQRREPEGRRRCEQPSPRWRRARNHPTSLPSTSSSCSLPSPRRLSSSAEAASALSCPLLLLLLFLCLRPHGPLLRHLPPGARAVRRRRAAVSSHRGLGGGAGKGRGPLPRLRGDLLRRESVAEDGDQGASFGRGRVDRAVSVSGSGRRKWREFRQRRPRRGGAGRRQAVRPDEARRRL